MEILKATLTLLVICHGIMIESVLIYSKDNVSMWRLIQAVMSHDNDFLKKNCDYYKARKLSTYCIFLATLGGIILKYVL